MLSWIVSVIVMPTSKALIHLEPTFRKARGRETVGFYRRKATLLRRGVGRVGPLASWPGPRLTVGHDPAPQVLCWKRGIAQRLVPSSALSHCHWPKLWHVWASSPSATNHDEHEEKNTMKESPECSFSQDDALRLAHLQRAELGGTQGVCGPLRGGRWDVPLVESQAGF